MEEPRNVETNILRFGSLAATQPKLIYASNKETRRQRSSQCPVGER
jgi:hypothetical protein